MKQEKIDFYLNQIKTHPLLSHVGNTPLIEMTPLDEQFPHVKIFAKAEFFNPGGSVKDRPALNMVRCGIRDNKFDPEAMTLLDATSGNTGIALAMIGAALSFKVCLCLPQNASEERKLILKAYGAEVVETDPTLGSDGSIVKARELYEKETDHYFYPDQYSNENNWKAHYATTGPEIWDQTGGKVTHFVTGLGTTGSFMGVSRFLKEKSLEIQVYSMEPDGPFHGFEGLKNMDTSLVPSIYRDIAEEKIYVNTEEAQDLVLYMAQHEGLFIGPSGGGNLLAAYRLAKQIKKGLIVTILPDGGSLYLSDNFWRERNASLPKE